MTLDQVIDLLQVFLPIEHRLWQLYLKTAAGVVAPGPKRWRRHLKNTHNQIEHHPKESDAQAANHCGQT